MGFQILGVGGARKAGDSAREEVAEGIPVLHAAQPLEGLSLSLGSRLPGAAPSERREGCLGAPGGDLNPCPRRLGAGSGVPKAAPDPLNLEGGTCGGRGS